MSSDNGLGFTDSSYSIRRVLQLYEPLHTTNKGAIYEDIIKDNFDEKEKNKIIDAFLKRIREDFVKHYINIKPEPIPVARPVSPLQSSPSSPKSQKPYNGLSSTMKRELTPRIVLKSSPESSAASIKQQVKTDRSEQESLAVIKARFENLFGKKQSGGSIQSYDLVMENIRQQLGIN